MSDTWWADAPLAEQPAQQQPGFAMDPRSRDMAIRTVLGEAANQGDPGMQAVAHVIRNRVDAGRYGDGIDGVIAKPYAFEPWLTQAGRNRMMAYPQDSEAYQRAAGHVDAVFGGQANDTTGGATHFVAPQAQTALGRQMPSWARGEPLAVIGGHSFFAPEGKVSRADAAPQSVPPQMASADPAAVPQMASAPQQDGNWWDSAPLASAAPKGPDTSIDVAKSFGVGVGKGGIGLGGSLGDARDMAGHAMSWLGDKLGIDPQTVAGLKDAYSKLSPALPGPASMIGSAPTSQQIQQTVEGVTGPFRKPETTAGKYAQTVGEFVPGMALPGGGGIARRALTAAGAGLGSEAAGQYIEGSPLEPYARVAGAVAGGMAPSALGRVVTPMTTSPARQEAVNALRREGVTDLTAGDITGSNKLRYFEQMAGGDRAAAMQEAKAEQFTAAALRRAGIQGEARATPEVIDNAFTRIGAQFDGIAARNNVRLDQNLGNEMVRVQRDYNNLVPSSARAPVVENTIRDIGQIAAQNNGILDGAAYQAMRSRLDKAARGSRFNDPQLSDALMGLRNGLDDAMARSMTNPADRAALRDARNQYRNMLVIEKAATSAGADAATGLVSPQALRQATVNQNRRGYARGQGDFAELARAGNAVLDKLPNSGTAQRLSAAGGGVNLAGMIGGGVGSAIGTVVGHPVAGGMVGAGIGQKLPGWTARAALSAPMRAYLTNQLLAAPPGLLSRLAAQGLLAADHDRQGGGLLALPPGR